MGHRESLDWALLWLWPRLAAAALRGSADGAILTCELEKGFFMSKTLFGRRGKQELAL